MSRTLILAFLCLPAGAASAGSVATPGRVTAVTVFQGQALVTRVIELPAEAGLVEAVVTDLPERLLAGSLYAEPGDGVEVRSVRTRNRPVDAAPREEVRALQEKLETLQQQQVALARERSLLSERANYLNSLQNFGQGAARMDLANGVLDADALREVTHLVFAERDKIAKRELELVSEERNLQKDRELTQRELATLTGGSQKTVREAVVFLSKEAGAASVRLMYLVGGAKWSPSYNVRAKEDRSGVTLEYNASVTQMSGEDWTDVDMTLSTATPSLVATSPKLEPLAVRLAALVQESKALRSKSDLSRMQQEIASNRGNLAYSDGKFGRDMSSIESASMPSANAPITGGLGGGGGFGGVYANSPADVDATDRSLNDLACAVQLLDLQAEPGNGKPALEAPSSTEGISVVYRLPNKTSLPSRSDQQLIQVAALPLDADFYRVATPVLTSYVYQEAKLTNATGHVLLAGPAATFLGDRFVGRGEIPQAAIGESFTVGLGIDESLRASRELADKSDKVQGGNRVARFDYVLKLENFGDSATTVRVLDRLPKSDGEAIKVTLVDSDPKATDAGEDNGLLRWDVEVPAAGEQSVGYTMTIEHDKNLRIVGDGK